MNTQTLAPGAKELLGDHMQLGAFSVTPITGTNLYDLQITIAYGDPAPNGPLTVPPLNGIYKCDTSVLHGDFCSVVKLSTVAQQRLSGG
jgi:hypothetical protein